MHLKRGEIIDDVDGIVVGSVEWIRKSGDHPMLRVVVGASVEEFEVLGVPNDVLMAQVVNFVHVIVNNLVAPALDRNLIKS